MAQYFDGPGLPAGDHSKANETAKVSRLERENNILEQQVKELEVQRHRLGEDLKRANTDLFQYKDRTHALQKQVTGLKLGKYTPDQVPEFKTHNPNQQIIKALLKENEELNKRIELLKEIKEKVTTSAANRNQSELFDALTYLEEENRNLRAQLNQDGEVSQHSILENESESTEIIQLREKLRVSSDRSRDLSDQMELMKVELENNKTLQADKNASIETPRRPVAKDAPMPFVARTTAGLSPQYMYPQMSLQRPQPSNEPIPFLPGYPRYEPNLNQYYPSPYINTPPPIPPSVIMPGGPVTIHSKEQPKHTGSSTYKQQDHLGYK